jgi:WD40 repeat protein
MLLAVLVVGVTAPLAGAAQGGDRNQLPPGVLARIGSSRLRHAGFVTAILYTPDGKWLVSAATDGFVRVWDARTGNLRWRVAVEPDAYERALAISADGAAIAVLSDFEYVVLASTNGALLARHTWPVEKEDGAVRTVAISSDMKTLARGCWDATVRLYDATTGQETRRFAVGDKAKSQIPRSVQFDVERKLIYVAASEKGGVAVYDAASAKLLRTLKTQPEASCRLQSSRDGRLIAGIGYRLGDQGSDELILWDLATDKPIRSLEKLLPQPICGAFSPEGRLFAVGGQGREIVILDTATGKKHARLPWHPSTLCLAFSPDGKRLAAAENGGSIAFWDTVTWKRIAPSAEPSSGLFDLHFEPDGKELRGTAADGIYWWNVSSGERLRLFPRTNEAYWWMWSSPDARLIVARSRGGDLDVLDASTRRVVRTLAGHKKAVYDVAFSPDGARLYSAGGFDRRVIVWDLRTGKILDELASHNVRVDHVAVSPDGRWLASWATDASAGLDYDIRLWDTAKGKLVHRLTPRRGSAFQIVFSADSRRLVSVGGEPGRPNTQGEVELWDVSSGKEIRAFYGHKERVSCVAITSDGRMIATGGGDKTLRLWEVASGLERRKLLGHESFIESVDFSPDDRLLAAASNDAPAFIWDSYSLELSQGSKLGSKGTAVLWQYLADADGAAAFDAVCIFVSRPDTVAVLSNGWKSRPHATAEQMRAWIRDLNSKSFIVRQKAGAQLERFTTGHEELLKRASVESASLEVRQHLEQLLTRLNPERLRRTRMLEVLEHVKNAAARQFLHELAAQTEDEPLAREAGESLQRLGQR